MEWVKPGAAVLSMMLVALISGPKIPFGLFQYCNHLYKKYSAVQ